MKVKTRIKVTIGRLERMGPYMLREKRVLEKKTAAEQAAGSKTANSRRRGDGGGEERLLRTLCRCWARKTGKELARPIL